MRPTRSHRDGQDGDVVGRRSVPHGDHGTGSAPVPVVAVNRPVAGVRFADDPGLIPPDTLRRCKICKQPIEHLDIRRVTCGHPRCMRANRNNKSNRPGHNPANRRPRTLAALYKKQREETRAALEQKVRKGYAYARAKGADQTTALAWVAKNTALSMIAVREIVEESK